MTTVLGIDPGYDRCGVAVVSRSPEGKEHIQYSACITTSSREKNAARLSTIAQEVNNILETHTPDAVAIEKLFFSKNQKTALLVAEARGAILSVVAATQTPLYEYSPQEVKLAVTGHGNSAKEQVAAMVSQLVEVRAEIQYDDEFDAIATALTCLATEKELR